MTLLEADDEALKGYYLVDTLAFVPVHSLRLDYRPKMCALVAKVLLFWHELLRHVSEN